ncbi:right-handed parallel beta-helix repeat-containing protein [Bacillus spongiae]|uniref:Right-handed parallel beta-helix repeat-containing protein n=1 Tax=Bacillus spongiae TaxID=2683610 RepID=A0ABU8HFL0_9BACI
MVITTLFFLTISTIIGIVILNEKTIVVPNDVETISDAMNIARDGDIILVKTNEDGTPYNEAVTIEENNIKLIGVGKEKPVLDGTGCLTRGISLSGKSGVVVEGFKIQNFSAEGILLENTTSNMIKKNTVSENGDDGIDLDDSLKNLIERNTVIENESDGIDLDGSIRNIIKGNIVTSNNGTEDSDGIELDSSDSNMIIENTISDSGSDGIDFNNSKNNIIKRNIITDNMDDGIDFDNSDDNVIARNTINMNEDFGILFRNLTNGNNVLFNRVFDNDLGINDLNIVPPLNNFIGNQCDTSNPDGLCN